MAKKQFLDCSYDPRLTTVGWNQFNGQNNQKSPNNEFYICKKLIKPIMIYGLLVWGNICLWRTIA